MTNRPVALSTPRKRSISIVSYLVVYYESLDEFRFEMSIFVLFLNLGNERSSSIFIRSLISYRYIRLLPFVRFAVRSYNKYLICSWFIAVANCVVIELTSAIAAAFAQKSNWPFVKWDVLIQAKNSNGLPTPYIHGETYIIEQVAYSA